MVRAADPSSSDTALKPFRKRQHAGCIVVGVVHNEKAKRAFQAVLSDDASKIARCFSACVPARLHWQSQQCTCRFTLGIDEVSHNTK